MISTSGYIKLSEYIFFLKYRSYGGLTQLLLERVFLPKRMAVDGVSEDVMKSW